MKLQNFSLLAIFLILLSAAAFAYESPLSVFDFNGLIVEKQSTNSCDEFIIPIPQSDLNLNGILSINSAFTSYENDSSYVTVTVNNGIEEVLWPEDFTCTTECWARVFMPSLNKVDSVVKICAFLGGLTKKVEVKSSSFVGLYDTPVLKIENQSPSSVFLGEKAKMSIIVSNSGSKAADIYVQFVHPDTRAKADISSFDIVDGNSSAIAKINENEIKQFDYYIKPTKISSYNLPSAALFFTNIFGERQTIQSARPQMQVINPNRVEISLIALSEQEPYSFKAIIKNNWADDFNGKIIISPQTAIQEPVQNILVKGNSEQEILLPANKLENGNYSFSASIISADMNNIYSSNRIDLQVKEASLPYGIIIAVLAIILGLGIFVWIYYSKN
jgi:hypothetical protein